jgi:hypothetical protein
MRGWLERSAFAPWAGLHLGALAWWLHHQVGSDLIYLNCRLGGPVLALSLAVACGLLALAGAWISWSARGSGEPFTSRGFGALVSVGAAGIFLLAIILQTAPGLILPGCYG